MGTHAEAAFEQMSLTTTRSRSVRLPSTAPDDQFAEAAPYDMPLAMTNERDGALDRGA